MVEGVGGNGSRAGEGGGRWCVGGGGSGCTVDLASKL